MASGRGTFGRICLHALWKYNIISGKCFALGSASPWILEGLGCARMGWKLPGARGGSGGGGDSPAPALELRDRGQHPLGRVQGLAGREEALMEIPCGAHGKQEEIAWTGKGCR